MDVLLIGHDGPARGDPAPADHGTPYGAGQRERPLAGRRARLDDASTVYLCPAPLYHAAPRHLVGDDVLRRGGTVVVLESFDAQLTLDCDRAAPRDPRPVRAVDVRAAAPPAGRGPGARARRRVEPAARDQHAAAQCPVPGSRNRVIDWLGANHPRGCYDQRARAATSAGSGPRSGSPTRDRSGTPWGGGVHVLDDDGDGSARPARRGRSSWRSRSRRVPRGSCEDRRRLARQRVADRSAPGTSTTRATCS